MNTESSQSHPGDVQGQPSPPARDPSPPIPRTGHLAGFLHWLLILLTLVQLSLGWSLFIGLQGPRSPQLATWLHASLGISLAILVVLILLLRLISALRRLISSPPRPPVSRRPRSGIGLRLVTLLLYLLLILVPMMGYVAAVFAGKTVPFWTLPLPHWGSPDPDLSHLLSHWHAVSALALTGVILLYLPLRLWAALRLPQSSSKTSAKTPPEPSTSASPRIPTELTPSAELTPGNEGPVPNPAPTEPRPARLSLRRRGLAAQLQIFGAVGFWAQVCLGLVAILLLMVTASSNYYSQNQLKLPSELSWAQGVVWANLAAVVLVATILGFYFCTRLASGLRLGINPVGAQQHARRLIAGLTVGCSLGLTLAILGTAFSIALLIAKTISQPPGIAITDPQTIVRAVDVFVLLANFIIVVAHFIGILISLWIRNQVQHLGRKSPVG
jgi:cytochrome b561